MRQDFIFAYGSLLNPRSLKHTLPDIEIETCVPARARHFARTWSVAFPNDGSQGDKSYRFEDGGRPGVVVFVNLEEVPAPEAGANGVLIPVAPDRMDSLAARERRYELEDVSPNIEVYGGFEDHVLSSAAMRVAVFVGRREFTRAEDIGRGVISREYQETIESGVAYWDWRVDGFRTDFKASTVDSRLPVVHLTRVDSR